MFTVWNDRPQAGSVHSDGSINLLAQRYLQVNDRGGVPERMRKPDGILTLSYELRAHKVEDAGKWMA